MPLDIAGCYFDTAGNYRRLLVGRWTLPVASLMPLDLDPGGYFDSFDMTLMRAPFSSLSRWLSLFS